MKYKVGDKVKIKSREWYNANKVNGYVDIRYGFTCTMADWCGETKTIISVDEDLNSYTLDGCSNYQWTDEMFEYQVIETRNISLTIEEAMQWYKEGGFKKELALKVFKENELRDLIYDEIYHLHLQEDDTLRLANNIDVIMKLTILANYFNPKGWKKGCTEKGYFIKKAFDSFDPIADCIIVEHSSTTYPLIYFKTGELAEQAAKLLTKEDIDHLEF